MTIKIIYSKSGNLSSRNQVLFSNEKFSISGINKYISNSELSYIQDLLRTSDLKKKLLVFDVSSKKKIVIISVKNNLKISEIESSGAEFYTKVKYGKNMSML